MDTSLNILFLLDDKLIRFDVVCVARYSSLIKSNAHALESQHKSADLPTRRDGVNGSFNLFQLMVGLLKHFIFM